MGDASPPLPFTARRQATPANAVPSLTDACLDTLAANAKDYQSSGANFALFLGLHFPHQPWYTPKWAVDFYSPIAGQNSP